MNALSPHLDENSLARYREEFPITRNGITYLNHAGVAPTSSRVCRAVTDSLERLARYGVDFDLWEEQTARCRQRFADLIGCSSDEVAFVRNTSHGLSLVAEGLVQEWKPGDVVLVARQIEYPSNVQVWDHLQDRGIEVELIPKTDGAVTVDAVEAALRPKKTKLVAVSSAQFGSGALTDLVALGQLCRERKVLLCVDGIQTVGALPIDVREIGVHFLSADSHKWMLGMMGMGALYVERSCAERMRPALVGWKSMLDGWNFDQRRYDLLPHAGRFEEGSPTYAMIAGFSAALALLQEVSVEAIAERVRFLVDRLVSKLEAQDFKCSIEPRPEHRHHILSIKLGKLDAKRVEMKLAERKIVVAARGGGVRVSPHFYNSEGDIEKLVGALDEIFQDEQRKGN